MGFFTHSTLNKRLIMSKLQRTLWQYVVAFAAAVVVIGGISWAHHVHATAGPATSGSQSVGDTLVVNTTDLAKDVIGYNGTTPLEIKLVDGVIVAVKALPNSETPRFFQRVQKSSIFTAPIGKTPAQVLKIHFDAVSGATFSSKAVIENLRRGVKSIAE